VRGPSVFLLLYAFVPSKTTSLVWKLLADSGRFHKQRPNNKFYVPQKFHDGELTPGGVKDAKVGVLREGIIRRTAPGVS